MTCKSDTFFTSQLFKDIQISGIFRDSKTFSDSILRKGNSLEQVLKQYEAQTLPLSKEDLTSFVETYFSIPKEGEEVQEVIKNFNLEDYIEYSWKVLKRTPSEISKEKSISLIPLKHPYVVPGGRFREMFYWDSYFTLLGLINSGENKLALDMVLNFFYLIEEYGIIPNGTRKYFLTRSQPPLLCLMVKALIESDNNLEDNFIKTALRVLMIEYEFWMNTSDEEKENKRVVEIKGYLLNRYYDEQQTPRPESYKEDYELSLKLPEKHRNKFFRDIRAACESGWDFSSRWFENCNDLKTIHTTDIIPVDLNCFMFLLEDYISELCVKVNKLQEALEFKQKSVKREKAINEIFYSVNKGAYFDYDIKRDCISSALTAATSVPLFAKIATIDQAESVCQILQKHLLKAGGIVTTTVNSGQQWDSPNGWAPLQYFTTVGLENYKFVSVAKDIKERWIKCIKSDFKSSKVLKEKYNVVNIMVEAGGGEYSVQIGFGWTIGVVSEYLKDLKETKKE